MGNIAIYEHDDLMYGLLQEWLCEAGYAAPPPDPDADVDLVIVSLTMPKQESGVLIRKLQGLHPGVPIIALTSQARSGLCSDGATARALGVERVMAKPLRRTELLTAVQALLARAPESNHSLS